MATFTSTRSPAEPWELRREKYLLRGGRIEELQHEEMARKAKAARQAALEAAEERMALNRVQTPRGRVRPPGKER